MSEFSSKCDLYDIFGNADDDFLQKSRFYIRSSDGRSHLLEIKNQKDLAKYYPYIVGCSSYNKEHGAHVEICSRSFIDTEEEDFIIWFRRDLIKYYKKCKRNKIKYEVNEALKEATWCRDGKYNKWEIELATRVGNYGEKASIEGLHRPVHDYFRKEWYNKLVELGYSENEANIWVYGWERWRNEQKSSGKKEKEGALKK